MTLFHSERRNRAESAQKGDIDDSGTTGYGVALFQKVLRLDGNSAKEFYGLFRDQYNSELSLPDSVVEELLAVGTFRSKEKDNTRVSPQQVRDWTLAEKALRP